MLGGAGRAAVTVCCPASTSQCVWGGEKNPGVKGLSRCKPAVPRAARSLGRGMVRAQCPRRREPSAAGQTRTGTRGAVHAGGRASPSPARLLVPCPPPRSVTLVLKGQPRGGTSRRASGRDAGCGSVPSRTAPMSSQAFPEASQALRQLESPRCSPPAGAGRQLFSETPSHTHTLDSKEPRKGHSRDFGLGG